MAAPSASVLWMLVAALASAALAALAHGLGPYVGWQGVLLSRTFFGFALALAAARGSGAPVVLVGVRTLWMRSIAGSVGLLLLFYAYTLLPVGDVLVLNNTAPVFTAYAERSFKATPAAFLVATRYRSSLLCRCLPSR